MAHKPSYEEIAAALAELEEIIRALRNQEIDAVVGTNDILMLRLRATEEALKKQRDDLNRLVKELEAANNQLESFSYSVSHDLRAPLRAIDGYSRMFLRKYGNKLDDEAARMINVIHDNTEKMGLLIDDLLSFSKVVKNEMRTSTIDMEALAGEIWRDIQEENPEREFEVRIAKLLPGAGDKHLIRQALFNIFSNAVKFTIKRKPAIIELNSYCEADKIVYSLKDNGVGFDMAYYDKLFGVFQRLHGGEYEGTGVGLAIVQRIINRHGGRVWAESEPDKGATFYFTLPTLKNDLPV
ncbi:MAG: Phytochrome-like protein cph1 [Syntrophus sp. SKADARSKE-3]|nr:Phytochrome-like protein cph1 [Syntrophus sp. SKADARSKE-3]